MKTPETELEEFRDMSHALLVPGYAQKIAGLFDLDCSELIDIFETSTEPKAYHGPTAEGVPAFQLSEWLCGKLNLEYTSFFGRGIQHRECCEVLERHLA